ncbi:putative Cysteine sulfinic acid decarboxylase-like protein [Naja naja]|nr:putative Cysteine sulfinic acid decarboxylase-like protein [Naja naja]
MAAEDSLSSPGLDRVAGEKFLQEAFQIMLEEGIRKGMDASEKVCIWKEPEELQRILDLNLKDSGEPHERLLERCRDVIRYSVKTCHPRFCNQLFSGLDPHALAGRMITEMLNTSQYTYEIAPVFVLMEEVVLKKLQKLCHYSIQKGAAFLGIGTDNVYLVATDEKALPFFVNATCGTTVLGAFDPLPEIAEAAWGGSALLSQRHRHLLDGIERADSVAWNPHKMLMTGLQCSAFLVQDNSGLLQRCHCAQATYLFQTDKFYDIAYDRGDQTIQCGRKVDCFKLWLMWKANGSKGLEQRVDRAFAYTRYLADEIKKREGFQLVIEPEFINLCFWYVPPSLRGQEGCTDYWVKLEKVAPLIKERMMKKGSMLVGYQPHGKQVNFFRQVVTNPAVTRDDLNFFLDEIERLGRDL